MTLLGFGFAWRVRFAYGRSVISHRAELLIAKGWIQGALLVLLAGLLGLGFLAYRTYPGE